MLNLFASHTYALHLVFEVFMRFFILYVHHKYFNIWNWQGKYVQPTNFDKERAYFQEVDAFELLEESPSPKSFSTWTSSQFDSSTIPSLCSRIEKWLISKKSKYSLAPSSTLSKILETPLGSIEPIGGIHLDKFKLKTPENSARERDAHWCSIQRRFIFSINDIDALKIDSNDNRSNRAEEMRTEDREDIEVAVKKLSLTSTSTSFHKYDLDPLSALLAVCGQSTPSTLKDVFSNYWFVRQSGNTYFHAFILLRFKRAQNNMFSLLSSPRFDGWFLILFPSLPLWILCAQRGGKRFLIEMVYGCSRHIRGTLLITN